MQQALSTVAESWPIAVMFSAACGSFMVIVINRSMQRTRIRDKELTNELARSTAKSIEHRPSN